MTLDEWRALREQVKVADRDAEPDSLAPPEAFSHRRADPRVREDYLPGHDPTAIRERSSTVQEPVQRVESLKVSSQLRVSGPTRVKRSARWKFSAEPLKLLFSE